MIAFSTDHPLVLGAVAIGAVALFVAAPGAAQPPVPAGRRPQRLTLAILNPFVSSARGT